MSMSKAKHEQKAWASSLITQEFNLLKEDKSSLAVDKRSLNAVGFEQDPGPN